ncbi:uncharacterized protein LOC115598252 isoform X2 [Calypte anna]|uniref:uncharacterized protein LOC115598252 isoform X2 n=1 Tax=Calypte anna TaxID=9244 RepID=UPI0011C411F9|nr:uncharacterized protein LOC115598252 isoform X2 [Calypte anna]
MFASPREEEFQQCRFVRPFWEHLKKHQYIPTADMYSWVYQQYKKGEFKAIAQTLRSLDSCATLDKQTKKQIKKFGLDYFNARVFFLLAAIVWQEKEELQKKLESRECGTAGKLGDFRRFVESCEQDFEVCCGPNPVTECSSSDSEYTTDEGEEAPPQPPSKRTVHFASKKGKCHPSVLKTKKQPRAASMQPAPANQLEGDVTELANLVNIFIETGAKRMNSLEKKLQQLSVIVEGASGQSSSHNDTSDSSEQDEGEIEHKRLPLVRVVQPSCKRETGQRQAAHRQLVHSPLELLQ